MAALVPAWRIKENWINPASASVQDYTLGIISELSKAGVDEIQLDYVRYPADGSTSTGVVGRSRSDVIAGFLKRVPGSAGKSAKPAGDFDAYKAGSFVDGVPNFD